MPVNTRKVVRRPLSFASLAEIGAELDRIEAAHRAGTVRALGNWTPGMIFDHLASTFRMSLDGFPANAKPPALLKWGAQVFFKKKAVTGQPPPQGIPFPKGVDGFAPRDGVSFDAGLADLRRQLARAMSGRERMDKPSPIFGTMTHENWTGIHRGHCALHLGFLDYPGS
jgi:hypothetical protein